MYHRKPQGWKKYVDFFAVDVLCLHLAFVLAYITRHGWGNPYANRLYAGIVIVCTLVDVLVLIVNDSMKDVLERGFYKELVQTAKHTMLVGLLVAMCLFVIQSGEAYSRIMFFLWAVYYCFLSYGVRLIWKQLRVQKRREADCTAIYLITTADRAENLVQRIQNADMREYFLRGICILDEDRVGDAVSGVPVTATRETVLKYLCDKWIDEVYISAPEKDSGSIALVNAIAQMGIVVHVEMKQFQTDGWQHQTIEEMAGSAVRTVSMTMATTRQMILKRMLDIVGGLVGCVLTLIAALIIGPILYIQSPGPILFVQTRVGRHGKKFKMYKFRSMYPDAEERKSELMGENRAADGMTFKLDFDPRIIGCKKLPDGSIKKGIGNFLRERSLDEMPQFLNVLKGELSLCGTRPPTVDEWEKYDLHHRARLSIKPGMTGLWQVSGRSDITEFEKILELDNQYIRQWSMGLDLRILLKTVKVVFRRKGAM